MRTGAPPTIIVIEQRPSVRVVGGSLSIKPTIIILAAAEADIPALKDAVRLSEYFAVYFQNRSQSAINVSQINTKAIG